MSLREDALNRLMNQQESPEEQTYQAMKTQLERLEASILDRERRAFEAGLEYAEKVVDVCAEEYRHLDNQVHPSIVMHRRPATFDDWRKERGEG